MRGPPNGKRLLGHSLLDLALILAALRQTNVLDPTQDAGQDETAYQHDSFYDDGPLLGIVSPAMHHFQQQPLWEGPMLSQKSVDNYYYDNIVDDYDNIVEEYDSIMRDIRARPPAIIDPRSMRHNERQTGQNDMNAQNNGSVITMILSIPNESSAFRTEGSVQVARNFNFQTEGAVGGFETALPYSADENFDLFNSFIPENMRDDDIDNLILSSINDNSGNSNQSFSDVRWQQYLSDFDSFYPGHKSLNSTFGNWGNMDILNEAMQSAELFLPFVPNSQNSSELELSSTVTPSDENTDLMTSSRLEMIETSEWSSQNHEEDLLFPLLPPPSYDEVMGSEQVNSTIQTVAQAEEPSNSHMIDHTYFNSSTPPPSDPEPQPARYAIRSRHEVSTRVISIPPRPRHISGDSSRSTTSEISEISEATVSDVQEVIVRSSVRRITTSSDGSVEEMQQDVINEMDGNSFEIRPVSSRSNYFQNLTNDVRHHREVVLCN